MTARWVPGADISVGNVIDTGKNGITIAYFTDYVSPLEPITGPGRIGHSLDGACIAIYDKHPMRIRVAP